MYKSGRIILSTAILGAALNNHSHVVKTLSDPFLRCFVCAGVKTRVVKMLHFVAACMIVTSRITALSFMRAVIRKSPFSAMLASVLLYELCFFRFLCPLVWCIMQLIASLVCCRLPHVALDFDRLYL